MPTLYLMVGYPGAGKTSVAKQIAANTGAVHLWADVERHKRFKEPSHTPPESLRLYNELNQRTKKLLNEGKSVVFDTSFNYRADRDKLRRIAARAKAQVAVVWVDTPLDVARSRAVDAPISRNGYSVSMTSQQFNRAVAKLDPPVGESDVYHIRGGDIDPEEVTRLTS